MKNPRTASRLGVALVAAASLTASALMAESSQPERPDMKLKVSTHHGFYPLDLTLEGSIQMVELASIDTCLLTVDWTYTTPAGQDLISKKEMPCLEPASGTTVPGMSNTVPEMFKTRVFLDEPGTYSYRIVLVSKTGKRFASASQEVKVIKSPVEVGATATRTDN